MIAITDTGCGMSQEIKSQIFKPFFTTKPKGKGTGLGLAIVYDIINQNKGLIDVISELNHGSEFIIYLPRIYQKEDLIDSSKIHIPLDKGSESILLIEDNPLVQTILTKILLHTGYDVYFFNNPHKALEFIQETNIPLQLLITDISMPQMDGFKLAQIVKQKFKEIKVIYISGSIGQIGEFERKLISTSVFIQKPFNPADLALKVRHLLDS